MSTHDWFDLKRGAALEYNERMKRCFSCKRPVVSEARPGRSEACDSCGTSLKVCLNCAFYEPASSGACREPSAERVVDKEKANFCEFFVFSDLVDGGKEAGADKRPDPLLALKALFKD